MKTDLALRPDTTATLVRVASTAAYLGDVVDVLPLATPADEAKAAEILREIKRLLGEAEEARKLEKEPYLRSTQQIDGAFRKARKPLEELEAKIRARLREAAEARVRLEREATERARAAVLAADAKTASAAIATIPEEVKIEGVSQRVRWVFETEDLSAVPEAFTKRIVNTVAVQAEIDAATAEGRKPQVPGLRFTERVDLSIRRADR